MSNSDARRFGFCVRCLQLPDASNTLTEHHTSGRVAQPNQVVFMCNQCHVEVHRIEKRDAATYRMESDAMLAKTRMLVSSRALRFVIEHRDRVAVGFAHGNRRGPSINIGPKGVEFSGAYGAVGISGKRYYFIPVSDYADDKGTVEVFETPDGIGGVGRVGAATGGWVRFRGQHGGILANFIKAHREHAALPEQLDGIEQD